jgi:NhaA family Na+:H+ antiporter
MKSTTARAAATPPATPIERVMAPFREFTHLEASGGIVLILAAIAALVWANSPWNASYFDLWDTNLTVGVGDYSLSKALHLWVNDGLMAIFFFVVGLEIKRELLVGELASPRRAILPICAAFGGAVVPACLFLAFNAGTGYSDGWGVPMATDIAFSLGVLALLGSRVPLALKVFLTALAIVDDLIAVLVIALFYTSDLSAGYLPLAAGFFASLIVANRAHVNRPLLYALLGLGLWFAFLKSGVHATIAGVLLATTIPARTRIDSESFLELAERQVDRFRRAGAPGESVLTGSEHQAALHRLQEATEQAESPMQRLEHSLHPWAAFAIVPIFALANAGVELGADLGNSLTTSLTAGIVVGLVAGKLVGITGFSYLAVRLGPTELPDGVSWRQLIGVSLLGGIGFTMSLFIAGLAFDDPARLDQAKIAILLASLIAGIAGFLLLRAVSKPPPQAPEPSGDGTGERAHYTSVA